MRSFEEIKKLKWPCTTDVFFEHFGPEEVLIGNDYLITLEAHKNWIEWFITHDRDPDIGGQDRPAGTQPTRQFIRLVTVDGKRLPQSYRRSRQRECGKRPIVPAKWVHLFPMDRYEWMYHFGPPPLRAQLYDGQARKFRGGRPLRHNLRVGQRWVH
jgi:hypothetical protein